MSAIGQLLHLRGFIEGVEVPIVSAQIQSQKNAAAVASIQIPSNDHALDFRPRSLVHIFEYDSYHGAPPVSLGGVGSYTEPGVRVVTRDVGTDPDIEGLLPPERFESSTEQTIEDLLNENYKLRFVGEVIGFSVQKSPTGRAIVLQCADLSSYWDIAYQYMVSGMSLGGGGIRAAFTGASTTVFNDFLDGSADVITRLIDTPPRSYPNLQGSLLGGVTHLIEAIGGIYYGSRAVRGVNDFFSLAEIRLHITQMLGANPYTTRDESRLLHANGFASLFRRALAGLGRLVTIRQVLLALQRYIFHEIVPITSPRYIPPLTDPNLPTAETVRMEEDPNTRVIFRAAQQIKARCEELKERLSRSTDTDTARDESDRRGGLATEVRRLTRLCTTAATRARAANIALGGEGRLASLFGLPEVEQAFSSTGERFQQFLFASRRAQRTDIRTYTLPAPGTPDNETCISLMDSTIAAMQAVMDTSVRRRVQRRTSQPDPPPRLITQVYRPDVWMCAPPRCNVIFPENYSTFSYGRNFQQEITRMLLRTHSAFYGSDPQFFDGFYMAPSNILGARGGGRVLRGRGGVEPPENSDAPVWVRRDLLDHELYTGIIPAFERMSDLNLHALRGGSAEIGGVRVGYAQLACNHIFFQYRFKSRQLMLSGRNNPYAVLGFPMLVIDKYLPIDHLRDGEYVAATAARLSEAIREGDGEVGSPEEREQIREANTARVNEIIAEVAMQRPNTHYLGTPAMISHSIDAGNGGTTQIQMDYARDTNERSEFFGDNVGRTSRAERSRNQRVTSVVGALDSPVVGARGPRGGKIAEVTDVTDEYQRRGRTRVTTRTPTGSARYTSTSTVPLFVPNRRATGRTRGGTRVVVGVEQAAESYGPEVVALVGGAAGTTDASTGAVLVTFRAWRVIENLGVYVRKDVTLAPEDITFPPWYGESWRTSRIGALYAYLFGTGALTDPTVVLDPRGAEAARYDGGSVSGEDTGTAADRSLEIRVAAAMAGPSGDNAISRGDADSPPPPGHSSTLPLGEDEEAGAPGEPDPEVTSVLANIEARSPIADATEQIVRAYSLIKLNRFDVHSFLRSYNWRPIASMVDLFGTSNLEISDRGEVVRGREGFHSRAFGDFDDLRQLIGPGEGSRPATILGLTTRDPDETGDDRATRDEAISARLDTRKEKRIAILRYINSLKSGCGILG